jgi:hypothetical protein
MSQAFVRESGGRPRIFETRESAESNMELQRIMDGDRYAFEVRARENGGYMIARLNKSGAFDSWVEE